MTSNGTPLAAPAGTQSNDSSLGTSTDSHKAEKRPLDAPKAVNRKESSDSYSNVVTTLNRKWRVIRCRDGIQWILQSRDSLKAAVGVWRGRSYCRSKEALLRVCAAHAGEIDPSAAAVLAALPDRIETRSGARSPEILPNPSLELGPKRENAALLPASPSAFPQSPLEQLSKQGTVTKPSGARPGASLTHKRADQIEFNFQCGSSSSSRA
jgi:hypothetical protein